MRSVAAPFARPRTTIAASHEMSHAKRPYVICHMLPSIDGRIVTCGWDLPNASREYERTAATFDADAWIIGRVSMEPYAGKARIPARKTREPIAREAFVAEHDAESYAIAVDPSGKLKWNASDIDGEHVITILTEAVSDDYLAFLQATGVSYLFGGKARIDVAKVLQKLRARFGIERLLLEGGGRINGAFLKLGLIDEFSTLIHPAVDGVAGSQSIVDYAGPEGDRPGAGQSLRLTHCETLEGGMVWLRHAVERAPG